MPKHVPPSLRSTKACTVCGLPFQWRKKWGKVWDEVKYCSERCRRSRALRTPSA
jgi:hypothetical protein